VPHLAFLDVQPVPQVGVTVTTGAGDIGAFVKAFKSLMDEVFDSQERTGMYFQKKISVISDIFKICIPFYLG
jgi:hypothetical protein